MYILGTCKKWPTQEFKSDSSEGSDCSDSSDSSDSRDSNESSDSSDNSDSSDIDLKKVCDTNICKKKPDN